MGLGKPVKYPVSPKNAVNPFEVLSRLMRESRTLSHGSVT